MPLLRTIALNPERTAAAKGGWKPALTLFVLAPMVGELLTSSAPPFIFFIPWVFLLFAMLYGCGALLIRELGVRWGSGWPGIVLMGAAYGILEEGLGAKSFFDPQWRALGPLGSHGRWLGVNWVWTIGLIIFHAAFCIGLSILAASLPFSAQREKPWLGRIALGAVALVYFLVLLLFYQKGNENGYRAEPVYYWISIAAAVLLVLAARFWRPGSEPSGVWSQVPAWFLGVTGLIACTVFVFLLYIFPGTGAPAWATAGLLIALAAILAVVLWRWSSGGATPLTGWQQFCLVAGAFGSFAIQAPLQEWNPARAGSASGMTAVGIGCALYLWWLRSRVRTHDASQLSRHIYG